MLSSSRKPDSGATYDASAARARAVADSKAAYIKAQQPRTAYTDARGEARGINPQDRTVQTLRRQLDHERWLNRDLRARTFYSPYWSRPVVYYHDPYNSFFWWWLLDRSLEDRAYWAYCHRRDMDEQRYRDLLARDAQLEGRISQLEAEPRPVDPAYVPTGVDPDLVYTDEYVDAVYNPVAAANNPVAATNNPVMRVYGPSPAPRHGSPLVVMVILAGGIAFGIWFVFFNRW